MPAQIVDLIAASPNLTTLYLPANIDVSRDTLSLMKDKIATVRGGGGKSLVRELVMQSVDMTGLFQLGDVFPEVECLGRVALVSIAVVFL